MSLKMSLVRNVRKPNIGNIRDAGYDFFMPKGVVAIIKPQEHIKIPLGIKVDIPTGFVFVAFDRSSVSTKRGLKVIAPVVDESYTGEIHACFFNYTNKEVILEPDEKIIQFILIPYIKPKIKFVKEINKKSDRGTKGFGSTNIY